MHHACKSRNGQNTLLFIYKKANVLFFYEVEEAAPPSKRYIRKIKRHSMGLSWVGFILAIGVAIEPIPNKNITLKFH